MKKTYITPSTDVLNINAQLMIAASEPKVTVDNEGSVEASDVEVKRNDYNVWNDSWSK